MICFNNIFKAYEKPVFSDFGMCLNEGVITALLGPSGGGKTTLINMLLGFEKPDKGSILGCLLYTSKVAKLFCTV